MLFIHYAKFWLCKKILAKYVPNTNQLNVESCFHQNPECANSNRENPPNRILNRFFFNWTLWKIRCCLNPKAQAVKKVQQQLRPELYLPEFFKSRAGSEQHYLFTFSANQLVFQVFRIFPTYSFFRKDNCKYLGKWNKFFISLQEEKQN